MYDWDVRCVFVAVFVVVVVLLFVTCPTGRVVVFSTRPTDGYFSGCNVTMYELYPLHL